MGNSLAHELLRLLFRHVFPECCIYVAVALVWTRGTDVARVCEAKIARRAVVNKIRVEDGVFIIIYGSRSRIELAVVNSGYVASNLYQVELRSATWRKWTGVFECSYQPMTTHTEPCFLHVRRAGSTDGKLLLHHGPSQRDLVHSSPLNGIPACYDHPSQEPILVVVAQPTGHLCCGLDQRKPS